MYQNWLVKHHHLYHLDAREVMLQQVGWRKSQDPTPRLLSLFLSHTFTQGCHNRSRIKIKYKKLNLHDSIKRWIQKRMKFSALLTLLYNNIKYNILKYVCVCYIFIQYIILYKYIISKVKPVINFSMEMITPWSQKLLLQTSGSNGGEYEIRAKRNIL
jgi:hypothetical protein